MTLSKRLTKTECALLARILRFWKAVGHARTGIDWGHTSGRRSYGNMEREAANRLRARGLVTLTSDGCHILYENGGRSTHSYLWHVTLAPHVTQDDLARLIEAGR